jgi:predicted Zn-dependent peptidase
LHSNFCGSLVGDNLLEALKLHAEIIRRPLLQEDQFALCRELAIQTLDSLEDDPHQKVSMLVREQFLPDPIGRPALGKRDELQQLSLQEVKDYFGRHYSASGSILAVAGLLDLDQVKEEVEKTFGSWNGQAAVDVPEGKCQSTYYHVKNEGAQVHIGLMYSSVNYQHKDYYKALAAVGVLSGGMGSRRFTEVREKRGLCYAVSASQQVVGSYGVVQCYLGSTPERAQEGLDVMVAELRKLGEGITQDELDRAKVGLRASLIMQGESTGARASTCARDTYNLGRVRSLDEIDQAIQSLTVEDVLEHVNAYPPKDFTVATIGPKELQVTL